MKRMRRMLTLVAALVFALAMAGLQSASAQDFTYLPGYVCHNNGDGTYSQVFTPNISDAYGHLGHAGDIIPDGGDYNGVNVEQNFTGNNPVIWYFGCQAPAPTTPPEPTATTPPEPTATTPPEPTATTPPEPTATTPPEPTATTPPEPTATTPPEPTATTPAIPTVTVPPIPTVTIPPIPTVTVPPIPTVTIPPIPTVASDFVAGPVLGVSNLPASGAGDADEGGSMTFPLLLLASAGILGGAGILIARGHATRRR
jgi:hypothetical protein